MQKSDLISGSLVAPRHLAVIMDGNGRWAKSRGKIRVFGHKQGAHAVRRIIANCIKYGVQELTLFAFSSENWNRPAAEVKALMALFVQVIKKETKSLIENGVQTKIVGDKSRFPKLLQEQIAFVENSTSSCNKLKLNIAANYGGRWDILDACKKICKQHELGLVKIEELTEDDLTKNLNVISDVDLVIRTGGEQRVSNFLMWQMSYAELYFSKTLWPDYDENDFVEALEFFSGRERRFGKISEQLQS